MSNDAHRALVRGDLTSEEYVGIVKREVDERLSPIVASGKMTHGPVTMAMADRFQERGQYEMAAMARRYAIDRPRWWHRFRRSA